MTIKHLSRWLCLLLLSMPFVLSGCSDDDDDDYTPPANQDDDGVGSGDDSDDTAGDDSTNSTDISGTAAAGAPMTGFVAVKDAEDTVRTADIGAGGSFTLGTGGLTAPYLMYASGLADGRAFTLYAAGTAEDVGNTVNITPLTEPSTRRRIADLAEAPMPERKLLLTLRPRVSTG